MSSWSIDPPQVSAILTETLGLIGEEGGTDGLVGDMDTIATTAETVSEMADSVPISIALSEFCGHYFEVMGEMAAKTLSGVEGAGDATTAYVNGNLEMAAEAQSNAGVVPPPDAPPPPPPNI
ncbi:DUF6507 family protein [Nocardiopsis alba]